MLLNPTDLLFLAIYQLDIIKNLNKHLEMKAKQQNYISNFIAELLMKLETSSETKHKRVLKTKVVPQVEHEAAALLVKLADVPRSEV